MTWLHMEFVLIFITGPSQIGQNGAAAAADARLAVPIYNFSLYIYHCQSFFARENYPWYEKQRYTENSLRRNLWKLANSLLTLMAGKKNVPYANYLSFQGKFENTQATLNS